MIRAIQTVIGSGGNPTTDGDLREVARQAYGIEVVDVRIRRFNYPAAVRPEIARRIISERQLTLLRDLASSAADARTAQAACKRAAESLATNPRDLPFALLYREERWSLPRFTAVTATVAGVVILIVGA